MAYRVDIESGARRSLRKLPSVVQRRIVEAACRLADNPRPPGCIKLQAEENAWRIRVGDYRIIYEIHDTVLLVLVIRIDHRRNVYR